MEKVGEHKEKTMEEASNSVEETRNDKEGERIRGTVTERFDPVDSTEEGSMVTLEDHDVDEYEMKDEEVLELFRRNNSMRPEVTERNNFPYLQYQEDNLAETEQGNVVFHSFNDSSEIPDLGVLNLDSPERLERVKPPSAASKEDTEDSSSDSDLDSNLSRYYFDGSLPVSAHVEESETHQDEGHVPEDDNQVCNSTPKQEKETSFSISNNLIAALAFRICLLQRYPFHFFRCLYCAPNNLCSDQLRGGLAVDSLRFSGLLNHKIQVPTKVELEQAKIIVFVEDKE